MRHSRHKTKSRTVATLSHGLWYNRDLRLLLQALILVLGVLCFIGIADEISDGETSHIDQAVILAFRQPDNLAHTIGPFWMETMMRDFTALGGWAVLSLVIIAVVGYLAIIRKYRAVVFVSVAAGGGQLLSASLKSFFDRPRPSVVPHLTTVSDASFPSGHSMMAAVVYLSLAALLARFLKNYKLKIYVIALAMVLTVVVGFSRVFLGVHYPSDVLAGWSAGLAWATGCWLIARQLQNRGRV